MICPKCAGAIPARIVQPHKEPERLLVERVVAHESLGVKDRLAMLVALRKTRNQLLESRKVELAEPFALVKEPFVVARREQVFRVHIYSFQQPGEIAACFPFPFRL